MSAPGAASGTAARPVEGSEILITCECGQQMRAPVAAMGKMGRCTLCGRVFAASPANTQPAPPLQVEVKHEQKKPAPQPATRIEAMDQLRGYAIFGMIVVNFLGCFHATPWFLDHQRHSYSYADTIAPLFLFVVGMGFRLSIKRRAERGGLADARWHALKRYGVLFLVAIAFYGPNYTKNWWDALTEIALAGILTLPLIDKPAPVRVVASFLYLGAFMLVFLGTGYGTWLHEESMNGGPLGMLGASFVLLFGTVAYDLLASDDQQAIVRWSLVAGIGLIIAAWVVWHFMPRGLEGFEKQGAFWPFSKRWGAAPFTLASTGIAFLTFLLFYFTSEIRGFSFPHLSILGENPLVIYLVQYSLLEMNGGYVPEAIAKREDLAAFGIALVGLVVFYAFVYAVAHRLHKDKVIIKL